MEPAIPPINTYHICVRGMDQGVEFTMYETWQCLLREKQGICRCLRLQLAAVGSVFRVIDRYRD